MYVKLYIRIIKTTSEAVTFMQKITGNECQTSSKYLLQNLGVTLQVNIYCKINEKR